MKHFFKTIPVMFAVLFSMPVFAQTGLQGPERPELMGMKPSVNSDDATGLYMEKTAFELIYKTVPQTKEFAEKLCARAKWARQIYNEMADGKRPEDEALAKTLLDEYNNFVTFILRLGIIAGRHTNVQMIKTGNGAWTYPTSPTPQFETSHWMTQVPEAKKSERARGYAACLVNNKYYFCDRPFGGGLVPVPIDDDELYIAQVSFVLIRNIGVIYETGAMQLLQEWYPNDKDRFEKTYNTCLLYLDAVNQAIENNDKVEIKYQSMPSAGAMNASMKDKVLPLEKSVSQDVVDCVVTSDSWEVETDAAGTPIRRVIYGYSIVQTKRGKQATRVSWSQEYKGGSYGSVHPYGVGGAQFYVR